MSINAIEVKNLSKSYRKVQAVDNISFNVKAGSSFGLLGLNGAGKTTTLKMLVSLIQPDSGTATVSGHDIRKKPMEVRRSIGYVSENPSFYTRMTAMETLRYLCKLLDVPDSKREQRIENNLQLVGLTDKKDLYIGGYSRGMRHRLSLAQALLSEPEILFLDEPTLGLDPLGAKNMRDLITRLKSEKEVTIVMSSHVLPEVEAICSEVGIFDHGKLIAQDSVEHLRNTASDTINLEAVLIGPTEQLVKALLELSFVNDVKMDGNRLIINARKEGEIRPKILDAIYQLNPQILSYGIQESSLEDILLRILKR
ncbi:MAG: ABC transporter ATP-binding protein [Firmicutes bacterium HGW-Firmicutes-15]|nr:MAG: ABC transporter ATP-binding protein [Firmicutes bacterium HGW-Firmicutes-15]